MSCVHPTTHPLDRLREASGVADLAGCLGMEPGDLQYLFDLPHQSRYKTFAIRKRSGGRRTISAPITPLKTVQRRLALLLALGVPPSPVAVGYLPGKSIVDHALAHRGARWILTLDLEAFFPSISEPLLRPLLQQHLGLGSSVATFIIDLCVGEGLPQGAPSSPVLSNLACVDMDRDLFRIAAGNGCVVTRYVDDICVSSANDHIPEELVTHSAGSAQVGADLRQCIRDGGFEINARKTRCSVAPAKHLVTGLVVGTTVDMPRKWKRQLRVLQHMLATYGEAQGTSMLEAWDDGSFRQGHPSSLHALVQGKKAFHRHVLARSTSVTT